MNHVSGEQEGMQEKHQHHQHHSHHHSQLELHHNNRGFELLTNSLLASPTCSSTSAPPSEMQQQQQQHQQQDTHHHHHQPKLEDFLGGHFTTSSQPHHLNPATFYDHHHHHQQGFMFQHQQHQQHQRPGMINMNLPFVTPQPFYPLYNLHRLAPVPDHHRQQQHQIGLADEQHELVLGAASPGGYDTTSSPGGSNNNSPNAAGTSMAALKSLLRHHQQHQTDVSTSSTASMSAASDGGGGGGVGGGSPTIGLPHSHSDLTALVNLQSLTLTMSPGSQSSTVEASIGNEHSDVAQTAGFNPPQLQQQHQQHEQQQQAGGGGGGGGGSGSGSGGDGNNKKRSGKSKEPSLRKSIDTFGQRTSIYRGVTRHRWTGRYEAHLWDNTCRKEGQTRKGRQVYLGGYDKEEKAARAYDLAALKYWGPTTTTNFPVSNYETEIEEMKHMSRQEFVASLRRKSSGFSRGASIYRGVTRHHQQGRWQARIGRVAGNKDLYLGTFSTQEDAAEAYDIAAIKFRGVNAVTNFDISRYDLKRISSSPSLLLGDTARKQKDSENDSLDDSQQQQQHQQPQQQQHHQQQPQEQDHAQRIASNLSRHGEQWDSLAYHQSQEENNSVAPMVGHGGHFGGAGAGTGPLRNYMDSFSAEAADSSGGLLTKAYHQHADVELKPAASCYMYHGGAEGNNNNTASGSNGMLGSVLLPPPLQSLQARSSIPGHMPFFAVWNETG